MDFLNLAIVVMQKYKYPILTGLICGLASVLWFIITYWSGANPFYGFSQKASILLQPFAAYAGIWLYREKTNNKQLSYGEGIVMGLVIAATTGLISALGMYALAEWVYPQMVADHVAELRRYMEAMKDELIKNSSMEMYEGSLKGIDFVNASTLAADDLIWKTIKGLMFGVLMSLPLRRKLESNPS